MVQNRRNQATVAQGDRYPEVGIECGREGVIPPEAIELRIVAQGKSHRLEQQDIGQQGS